jgi:predicted HAD superfamily phosphohydrolase YqeG
VNRIHRFGADRIEAVCRVVAEAGARTVVLDVQPMFRGWRSSEVNMEVGPVVSALRAASPELVSLVFASNARRLDLVPPDGCGPVVVGARKPWRVGYLSAAPVPIVVVGDQVVTDGLLAWRIGATFVHWRDAGPAPKWPRIQRGLGRVVARWVFINDEDGDVTAE